MKLASIMLLPVVLTACMVDTAVVKDDQAADAGLNVDIQGGCESFCEKAFACDSKSTPEICIHACVEYFGGMVVGRGDICKAAARRVMDCYGQFSCSDAYGDDLCNATVEEERCAASNGEVLCHSSYIGGDGPLTPPPCDVEFTDCSDDREYLLSCPGTVDDPDCHCVVDGEITGSFSPTRGVCLGYRDAKLVCGWPIPADGAEPFLSKPVICGDFGGTGSGDPGNCFIEFQQCSDGETYGILCDETMDTVSCRCLKSGDIVGFSPTIDGTCPFAQDIDSGAVALNYACAFHLVPPNGDF